MNEGQLLLLVFALVYLSSSIVWCSREAYCFRTFIGRKWNLVQRELDHQSFPLKPLLLNPFPSLGGFFACYEIPISLSVDGLITSRGTPTLFNRSNSDGFYFSFEKAGNVTCEGKVVRANGTVLARVHSEIFARYLAGVLERVRMCPRTRRA